MPSILLSAPLAEPVTLADVKAYLRVEHDDDDDTIAALLAAARAHLEALVRRALITQTWRLVRDEWPSSGRIAVSPAPLRELTGARIHKADGTTQPIDIAAFSVDASGAVLSFAAGAMPAPGRPIAGIELEVEVGYGDQPDDVPDPLRQAIRILVAHWYENRGAGEVTTLPASALTLVAPYRVLSL